MNSQPDTDPTLQLPARLLAHPTFLMLELLRHGRRRAERTEEGPQLPRFMVLAVLDEFGTQSQRQISDRLRFDASDLVAIVDGLQEEGMVTRERDPADRRRYAVAITDAGREALIARDAKFEERVAESLPTLSAAERRQLHDLLLRALGGLDPRVPPP
jgi:DNA-binding MarR family transcriptional regulator